MQNFTLGKRGLSMLFFAFFLLIGNLSSFGQCPTVSDNTQEFCDALATVADLQATDDGGGISWYDGQTSTSAIPENEILENNKIYYAGANNGTTCPGNRQTVTVSFVDDPNDPDDAVYSAPVLEQGEDEFFTPCERSANNPDANTIGDLRAGIDLVAQTGYTIEYFADQFDRDSPQLSDATVLVSGTSYFAGYVGTGDNVDCQSSRLPLRYEPIVVNAPAAQNQTVCEGTTLGELEAEGTNRWYRTETSEPPLSNNTVVEDGVTYWATLIVPSDGPPCESVDRTPVTVTVEPAALNETTQSFCKSIGEGNDFRTPEVRDLSPEGATWFADATSTEALDPQTELMDGEDYFNRDNGSECSQDRVVVEFFDTPNAGMTTQVTFCSNDPEVNLVDSINRSNNLPDEPVSQNGFFTPSLEDNMFNPSDYVPGSITFTYTVPGNDNCPTDTSQITVVVEDAPNAGDDTPLEFCQNEFEALVQQIFTNPEQAEATFASLIGDGVDTDGDFTNDDLETIADNYLIWALSNPTLPFNAQTTYTVTNENGCSDSSLINLTVNPSPNAGDNGSVEVSRDDAPFNLFTELEGNPDANGTWSPGNADGSFDPATGEQGTYTYTVTNGNCIDTATVTVTILEECPVVEETTQSFCESIGEGNDSRRPRVADLMPTGATWYATADSDEALASDTVLVDGNRYFAGNSQGTCNDRTGVLVNLDDSPNAGRTTALTVCSNEAAFDLVSRINESILGAPDAGGTFTPALASGTTIFDPAVDVAGQYTYRVESTNDACPDDTASITVNITNVKAGENGTVEVSREDAPFNLFTELSGTPMTGGTWTPGNADGFFNPATGEQGTYTYTVTNGNCIDTASVNVIILEEECPVVETTTQSFCESIGEGNNSRRPRVSDLLPTGATWYSTADSDVALASNTELVDGTTYFAGNSQGTCNDRTGVLVNLDDSPNAGRTTALNVCSSEAPFDLVTRINESILGAPDAGGTFTPALASGSTIFDPAVDVAGTYTYTVQTENEACEDDSSIITITITNGIVEAPINETVCSAELNNLGDFVNEFSSLLEGRDTGGTFAPTLETLFVQYTTSPIGNFTTVYTVGPEGECQSSVEINVTVLESPNAGEDGTVEVSRENAPFNLFTELNGTPDTGGTWSPGNADGSFDPANGEQETYTYSVTNGTCTDTATVTVTITDEPLCPVVTDNTQSFCESIDVGNASRRPRVSDLMPANAVWYETATSTTPLASTIVLINGEDYFAGNADVTCPARPRVVVTLDESPNAGRTTDITVCSDDASFDLLDRINESILGAPDAGGTFTPALASGTTVFNPAVDVATTYTYRVESTNDVCPADTAQITVRINQSGEANAGDPFTLDYCVTAEDVDLFAELGEGVTQGGTFEGYPNGIFSPATLGEGTYVVNYNVGEGLPCITGTDSSTLTITVTATGETPVAEAEQTFCLVNDPTVANLVVTGEGDILIYEDAELTTLADGTSPLVDGADYYAVSSSTGNACGSDAAMITVVLTDADAPTLIDEVEGGKFCRSDNPTVQELISNLNGSGIQIYTSLTGGTAIPTTTALDDGVTYFASATNSTTQCESAERTAVQVEVAFCGIPEGFSPNDDGQNDTFEIEDIATDFPNYTIQVYNRWGSLVFEGNASTGDWDGLSNQSATLGDGVLPAGVYFYILDYNDGQTQPVQGKVYLSR